MSRGEATLQIWCDTDGCKNSIELDLCPLASQNESWDDRNINRELERNGWETYSDIEDYCPSCIRAITESEEELEEAMEEELDKWFKHAKAVGWATRPDVIAAKDRLARMR